jgi:hypothetical protein
MFGSSLWRRIFPQELPLLLAAGGEVLLVHWKGVVMSAACPYLMPLRWLRSFSFSRHTYSINSNPGFSCSTRFCVHGST